ncbi:hypothetical protein J6590_003197 [Homalodisca vitripennis]|nr:hypothetical protein J6590_003197 [Homalodisca vitripennis]
MWSKGRPTHGSPRDRHPTFHPVVTHRIISRATSRARLGDVGIIFCASNRSGSDADAIADARLNALPRPGLELDFRRGRETEAMMSSRHQFQCFAACLHIFYNGNCREKRD